MTIIKVVEPHALIRLGLLQLIANVIPDVTIEGADYADLRNCTGETRDIDLVLLSISPAEDANHLIDAVLNAYAPRYILLLSEQNHLPGSITLPAVVCGHVPKNAAPEVLQASIRLVLAGGTCFPLRKPLMSTEKEKSPAKTQSANAIDRAEPSSKLSLQAHAESELLGLTPRQYEVLVLLSRGYPMKTVGRYLNISVATAKAHTETLYQRLDVHNRNAAVYAAVSRGAKLGWTCIGGNGGQSEGSNR